MKKGYKALFFVFYLSFFYGCSTFKCNSISQEMTEYGRSFIKTEMIFGLSRPDGRALTEDEWQNFVNNTITPGFREGLTVINAYGQWMIPSGEIIKEKSKIVILIYKHTNERNQAIEKIITEYKNSFQQEAVLRMTEKVNVSF